MAYDAVVIGSGFGGAFSALALTEAGLRVLLVERGLLVKDASTNLAPAFAAGLATGGGGLRARPRRHGRGAP